MLIKNINLFIKLFFKKNKYVDYNRFELIQSSNFKKNPVILQDIKLSKKKNVQKFSSFKYFSNSIVCFLKYKKYVKKQIFVKKMKRNKKHFWFLTKNSIYRKMFFISFHFFHKNLFSKYNIFFKSFLIQKFIQKFIIAGKLTTVLNLFIRTFMLIFLTLKISPSNYIFQILYLLKNPMILRTYIKSGQIKLTPLNLPFYNQIIYALTFFKKTVHFRKELNFVLRFLGESVDLLFHNSGLSITKYNNLLNLLSEQKTSIKFRKSKK